MSDPGGHKRAALTAATKAVKACNVRWATAIDAPDQVATAALQAAAPHLYEAERARQRAEGENQ